MPAFQVSRHAWTPSRTGSLSVSLAWPDTTVDLDLYVAPASCLTLYPQTPCGVLASSRGATGSSETVVVTVQAGQALALFVDNLDVSRAQGYTLSMSQR